MSLSNRIKNLPMTVADLSRFHLEAHRTIHDAIKVQSAAAQDTGWRNISAATTSTNRQGFLRRVGNTVYLTFLSAKFDTTTGSTIYSLPTGFRPGRDTYFESVPYWSADTRRAGRARVGGEVEIRSLSLEDTITFNTSWPTDNPWPTTLPGNPA